ncbi:MAG: tRNA (adenosine(37)-N6)-threonylcarbamoyltransferase complex dimerization subunit type 1 TsaB [Cellvibrionales bacterium]|nr:tRNA (adenosine(37)-N6)-threonylcarbamoyltransferase complex dimerization subunit type 1 TsaB [Cellvibrionales bacterium]
MNLLVIESSSQLCLVALHANNQSYERSTSGSRSHSEHLLNFVHQLLEEANLPLEALDAIAYSAGPGSFTGIRLAASAAKSLAYAVQKPVISLSSLEVIAATFFEKNPSEKKVSVLMDARMGDVYYGCYANDTSNNHRQITINPCYEDKIFSQRDSSLSDVLLPVIGDAQHLFPNLSIEPIEPSANALISLARRAVIEGKTETALNASPIYLRDKSSWKTLEEQQKKS